MKNITFNEQISLFLENKAKEALGMCTQESTYMRSHNACARRHNPVCACRVQETKQGMFSALILRFGTNPTSSKSCSKPLFSQYK